MDASSRALWRKSSLLPSVLCSHCSGLGPLRWIAKRTVRMASFSSSAAQSAAAAASASPSAATDAAASSSVAASASCAIDFFSLCHRLKTTKRAGWVKKGVREPESVADHMYRMSVMALVAEYSPDVDRERCIKMALVHDIAEAIVGDITPSDGVPKDEKSRREREAINHMCNLLGGGSRAKEILELWMEYEENSSLEAKVVKDFDKVEMILQALEYEQGCIWRNRRAPLRARNARNAEPAPFGASRAGDGAARGRGRPRFPSLRSTSTADYRRFDVRFTRGREKPPAPPNEA